MSRRLSGSLLMLFLLLAGAALIAQQDNVSAQKKAAVKETIQTYIEQDQQIKGAFLIKDSNTSAVRELDFDYVHDGVHKTDDGRYYACVDFKQAAQVLDLDFFLEDTGEGRLRISEIVIHKIDGKAVPKQ